MLPEVDKISFQNNFDLQYTQSYVPVITMCRLKMSVMFITQEYFCSTDAYSGVKYANCVLSWHFTNIHWIDKVGNFKRKILMAVQRNC